MIEHAILLIGSPKNKKSSSYLIGKYLANILEENNITVTEYFSVKLLKKDRFEQFIGKLKKTDILIISSPLYVDSLPYPITNILEKISEHKISGIKVIGIMNNGFPEAYHNEVALMILKQFCISTNNLWLGGLALGMGGGYMNVANTFMARKVKKSLSITANAILNDRNVPEEAVKLMSSKLMPIWLYNLVANNHWKSMKKYYNSDLNRKPFKEE